MSILDDEEVRALLERFGEVWRRVSPSQEAERTPAPEEAEHRAAVRAARWFPEI